MKTLSAFALVALFATASAAGTSKKNASTIAAETKAGSVSCTTMGDAMGSIVFKVVGSNITGTEFGMDDSVTKYGNASQNPGGDIAGALKAGKPANFWFRTKKSNEFGGAVSDAILVALGGKQASGTRNAYMSARGVVYIMTCQN